MDNNDLYYLLESPSFSESRHASMRPIHDQDQACVAQLNSSLLTHFNLVPSFVTSPASVILLVPFPMLLCYTSVMYFGPKSAQISTIVIIFSFKQLLHICKNYVFNFFEKINKIIEFEFLIKIET